MDKSTYLQWKEEDHRISRRALHTIIALSVFIHLAMNVYAWMNYDTFFIILVSVETAITAMVVLVGWFMIDKEEKEHSHAASWQPQVREAAMAQ